MYIKNSTMSPMVDLLEINCRVHNLTTMHFQQRLYQALKDTQQYLGMEPVIPELKKMVDEAMSLWVKEGPKDRGSIQTVLAAAAELAQPRALSDEYQSRVRGSLAEVKKLLAREEAYHPELRNHAEIREYQHQTARLEAILAPRNAFAVLARDVSRQIQLEEALDAAARKAAEHPAGAAYLFDLSPSGRVRPVVLEFNLAEPGEIRFVRAEGRDVDDNGFVRVDSHLNAEAVNWLLSTSEFREILAGMIMMPESKELEAASNELCYSSHWPRVPQAGYQTQIWEALGGEEFRRCCGGTVMGSDSDTICVALSAMDNDAGIAAMRVTSVTGLLHVEFFDGNGDEVKVAWVSTEEELLPLVEEATGLAIPGPEHQSEPCISR
jgi:hypothetical protein